VVDASTVVDLLIASPVTPKIVDRLFVVGKRIVAPHLIDIEVTNALRKHLRTGMPYSAALDALTLFAILAIDRRDHLELLPRILELRQNITAYDAAYVALAEALDATLVTRDRRLSLSSGHAARIEYID